MIVSQDYVLLARHGQTEWNVQGRKQGQLDSALTIRGVDQARRAASVVRGRAVDTVFTSPLGRAAATAAIYAEELGVPTVVIDELAEVHHGQWAGMTDIDINHHFPGELERRARDKYRWRFPGGESYADADQRAGSALAKIADHATHRPLIVSHEMIGRMLLRHLLNLDPDDALQRHHPHNVVYEIDTAATRLSELHVP